jgi:hypothetical protein
MRIGIRILGAAMAVSAATTMFGAAASLGGLSATQLGADGGPVAACDSNGFSVSYVLSSGTVVSVTVSGIADPACEGGQLSLTLTNGSTSVGSGGAVTITPDGDGADNSVTVPISPQPNAASVNGIHIVVVGP